jgi:flavin-dependent dehydrogenase
MAMHSSKLAAKNIAAFLQQKINRKQLEKNYTNHWKKQFSKRLLTGRVIQQLFGKIWATNLFISLMKKLPRLTHKLIKQTHGEPF